MNWTRPADLKAQVRRWWERGELARARVTGEAMFPRRLSCKTPSSADLGQHFEEVRHWVTELTRMPQVRLEWRTLRHRVQGSQQLPHAVWVDSLDEALQLIDKMNQAQRLDALVAHTRQNLPAVLPWLSQRPLKALELSEHWTTLLSVCHWVSTQPQPGIYLRQVDIPGVHSKFIEAQRSVLAELFDLVLPDQAIREDFRGVQEFARRYGFRDKPVRIRMRVLDAAVSPLDGVAEPDLTLDADSFSALRLPLLPRVFITENETNFLALPALPRSIVIFGAGYGWDALAQARWLQNCAMHYWGDIDTHGFAILDQLRGHFAHVASLLMDRDTLDAHQAHWGEEARPCTQSLSRLDAGEMALYNALRHDRIRPGLRLEQERIGYGWLKQALARL